MKRLLAFTAIASAALFAFAQVRETVNVNVIEVPVTVIDANGDPIRNLTVENFELTDNGQKRPITSFDRIDFASSESLKATSPLNPAARRNFMLLFDLSNAAPGALARAQDAARKFVAESVLPRDLVAVATIESQRGFRLLSAFTTDRQLVEQAIAQPTSFRGMDPLQLSSTVISQDIVKGGEQQAAPGKGNSSEAAAEFTDTAIRIQRQNAQYMRDLAEKQITSLASLAKTLRAVPGRKQIVLLSEGFDPKYIQGRDVRATDETAREQQQILSGQTFNVDNDERFGSTSSLNLLDRMAQTFRGSDVVLHAIDIQGVRVENDVQQGARLNSNDGLFLLANPTGGSVYKNANDVKTNFAKLLHQQEVVYVLGFQAPTQKPGAYHNLKVRLVNVPSGARASSRAGYYEAGGETQQERVLSNAEVIVNDIPQDDVHMTTLAAAFPDKSDKAQVPVIVEADGNDLIKDLKGSNVPVEFYIYAFDSDGVVRDRLYQKIGLDLKKVGDRLRSGGLKYYATLSLPPGSYAVKSLLRVADTERRGFGRVDIVVPKPSDMATAAVPMDESPKAVLVKGNSHSTSNDYPFQLNGQQFIPASAARKSAGPQKIAVFVYGAGADDATVETNPKTKFLGRAKGMQGTALVVQLDPNDATAKSVDVTVRSKSVPTPQKSSVTVVQ